MAGRLPVSDLTRSALDQATAAQVVRDGRNAMPAHRDRLAPADIDAVVAFVLSLRPR